MELHKDVVRRDVTLDCDRREAWRALAHPRRLEEWFARDVALEIREGARGTVTDHDGTVREALVEEVVPDRRLALRWQTEDGAPTIVELTLDDVPGGRTRLVVVEVPEAVVRAVGTRLATSDGLHGPALVAA